MRSRTRGAAGFGPRSRARTAEAGQPTGLALASTVTPSAAIVTLHGELDIATADDAVAYVRDIIDRYRRPVVLDARELSFCDARGLSALVRMKRHAAQADCALSIASPSRLLRMIMRITGLSGDLLPRRPASPGSLALSVSLRPLSALCHRLGLGSLWARLPFVERHRSLL
jgi:anti-sigma B factor antagonist